MNITIYVVHLPRGYAIDNSKRFFTSSGIIVDLLCTFGNSVSLAVRSQTRPPFTCSLFVLVIYLLFEMFRVIRMVRLLQFASRYNGIIVLLLTLKQSFRELLLLMAALGAGVIVFGFMIYISEIENQKSKIDNFIIGFWWAIVTMTTLGYGDIIPTTIYGYMTGSICAVSGMIFMALQVPVIANKFNLLYVYATDQAGKERYEKEAAKNNLSDANGLSDEKDEGGLKAFTNQLKSVPNYAINEL